MDSENNEIFEELAADGEKSGVQQEINEDISLEPFDPNEISITSKGISLDAIVRRMKTKSIRLSPDFQRNTVWDSKRKSQLIESLMLNIPIAIFYVAEDEKGNWDVVDGLQRLTAIKEFVLDKTLKLEGLEFWEEYNGKIIDDLPPVPYNRIMETEFNIVIIEPGTPESVKYNIFKRINTGGMQLSGQEIRHALFQGKGTELLVELAKTEEFLTATDNSVNPSRMADRELILRFLSFLIFGPEEYASNDNMDDFLRKGLNILNHIENLNDKKLIKEYGEDYFSKIRLRSYDTIRDLFALGMKRNEELFGKYAFRISSIIDADRRSPINKALFETWGCELALLPEEDFEKLIDIKDILYAEYEKIRTADDFYHSVSRDSWKKPNVELRFKKINSLIQEVINAD